MSITDAPLAAMDAPGETKRDGDPPALTGKERRRVRAGHQLLGKEGRDAGKNPTVAALDLAEINSADWSHRFIIAVDPLVENSSLLLYGADFARLLNLPPKGAPHVPMVRQLPRYLSRVFMQGCGDAHHMREPIRVEGEVKREDGRRELYRAAFIPVGVKENSLTHLALGAFNSRVLEPALAA